MMGVGIAEGSLIKMDKRSVFQELHTDYRNTFSRKNAFRGVIIDTRYSDSKE